MVAFNIGPSIIQHLGAPSEFLMEASLGSYLLGNLIKNSTKIHEKYGSHWFYLTESLENIGGNKRIGGTFC